MIWFDYRHLFPYSDVVPSDDELKLALGSLRVENPTLGIAKTQGLLLSINPTWTVSEKRVRKGAHRIIMDYNADKRMKFSRVKVLLPPPAPEQVPKRYGHHPK
jgi:hypothetical protein